MRASKRLAKFLEKDDQNAQDYQAAKGYHSKSEMRRVEIMKATRETTLLDKSTFDDPNDSCLAGSTEEADMLAEWSRDELVEEIQRLDQERFIAKEALRQLEGVVKAALKAIK